MTNTILIFATAIGCLAAGILVGHYWHASADQLTLEELRERMDAITKSEEQIRAEGRQREQMRNARRRSAPRPDAGPPSTVRRMTTDRPVHYRPNRESENL